MGCQSGGIGRLDDDGVVSRCDRLPNAKDAAKVQLFDVIIAVLKGATRNLMRLYEEK